MEFNKKGDTAMRKMTKTEMRQVNGGKAYHCTTGGWCWYTTPFKSALGWHFLQCHGDKFPNGPLGPNNCSYRYY